MLTERTCVIRSVTTRTPFSSTLRTMGSFDTGEARSRMSVPQRPAGVKLSETRATP
jgi:hypothetical protein